MNPETRKILFTKINELETKLRTLMADKDNAERHLKNAQAQFENISTTIKTLEQDKLKIKEDLDKEKVKE